MEPVSLVLGALASGALAGTSDTAKNAVAELYSRVRARFRGDSDAEKALALFEKSPDKMAAMLAAELERLGLLQDGEIARLSQQILDLTAAQREQSGANVAQVMNIQADRGGAAAGIIAGDVTTTYNESRPQNPS
jgi:protein subunit release factor A